MSVNALYTVDDKPKLAGTIRGSYFVIKGEY
jgi:hypothetical protein